MTQNECGSNSVAPITNIRRCLDLMQRSLNRPKGLHLPGIVVFYGHSGYGKTTAAGHIVGRYDAVHVEFRKAWTQKFFLKKILQDCGVTPAKTVCEMLEQVCEYLSDTRKPLIIDEMDRLIDRGYEELVRDIYMGTEGTIVLIGEEHLKTKIKKNMRLYRRVLAWEQAMPMSMQDLVHLSRLYAPGISIDEELLIKVHERAKGSTGIASVALNDIYVECRRIGSDRISLNEWPVDKIHTGEVQ